MILPNGDNEEEMVHFNRTIRGQCIQLLKDLEKPFLSQRERQTKVYLQRTIQNCERYLLFVAQKE